MPSMSMSSRDIRAVYAGRRAAHGPMLSLYARASGQATSRFAVVAGRGVGNAVTRNRAKRRLRALARAEGLAPGDDTVLVARAAAARVPFPALVQEYRRLAAKVGRG